MSDPATKQDIEDVLTELRTMMQMVGAGFSAVDMRFNEVDVKFHTVDMRLARLEFDVSDMKYRLDGMAKHLEIADQERLVTSHQIERAFTKLGIELT